MKQFKLVLVLGILLSAILGFTSTARADADSVAYVRFRESHIVLWPGLHRKVIIDYGNLTNTTITINQITCGLNPKYGVFDKINKVRFERDALGFSKVALEEDLSYYNDTLPPH